MTENATLSTMARAYARWAPVYDAVYARMLRTGRQEAAKAALQSGSTILEVGVGTGLSLADYPDDAQVIGIDLSKPMLDRAAEKIEHQHLAQVRGLCVMDACRLGFKDASFDAVVGQYMITLVPDAEAALDEFARVLKPGGEIVLVNHIGAENGPMAVWEKAVAPIARRIGLSSEFPLQRLRDWATSRGFGFSARKVGFAGFFMLIRLKDNRATAKQTAA